MKKFNSLLTGLLLTASVFLTQQATAQAPQKMSYQSVIRNSSNVLVASTPVGMQISVLQGNDNGTAVFVETQTAITNANGLVSLEIGTGSATTGTFSEIDWATGPYFIKTEIDPTGGTNYTITGTQQMASVPFALYAAKSGGTVFETTADDATAIHNTNAGNVGIGTDLPSEKLDVAGNVRVRENLQVEGNSTFSQNLDVNQNLNVNQTLMVGGSINTPGNSYVGGTATANSFVKDGGTSSQFLMADGTVSTRATGGSSVFVTTTDNTNNISNVNSGNVGIGTDLPSEKLDVAGNLKVRENATIQGIATADSFVKTGGTSSQFLMADGSTSAGTVATTMGTIGTSATANGATITSGVLSLTPANATNGGVVTTGAQTFAGAKTFTQSLNANSFVKTGGTSSQVLMADGSVSTGVTITSGIFSLTFSTQNVIISYKLITDGTSKIVYLNIPYFNVFGSIPTTFLNSTGTLPLLIRPNSTQYITSAVMPTSSSYPILGYWVISSSGSITLYSNGASSQIQGAAPGTISYIAN